MIFVTDSISISEDELDEMFVLAQGPGGQNVNKVATAVQLRFDAANSPALTPPIVERLRKVAGRRMTKEGVISLTARRYRSQEQNRRDARDRLLALIREAAVQPKRRHRTRPSRAVLQRRTDLKKHRSRLKERRGRVGPEE